MLKDLYCRVRPYLPVSAYARYNGVLVNIERKFLDARYREFRDAIDYPEYEVALVDSLNKHVRAGDTVVVIGGGLGVTACVAAQRAGPEGRVICYEGNSENATHTRRALALNGVAETSEVHEAIVAVDISVYEGPKAQTIVAPDALPTCDVLQLDCEGAELEIISKMTIRPNTIIVETHGYLGATSERMTDLLQAKGYSVTNIGPAEPAYLEFCQKNDIMCLIGLKN